MVYRGIQLIERNAACENSSDDWVGIRLWRVGEQVEVKNLTECMQDIGGKGIGEGEAITVHAMRA